jgi:hypothetical protein
MTVLTDVPFRVAFEHLDATAIPLASRGSFADVEIRVCKPYVEGRYLTAVGRALRCFRPS